MRFVSRCRRALEAISPQRRNGSGDPFATGNSERVEQMSDRRDRGADAAIGRTVGEVDVVAV